MYLCNSIIMLTLVILALMGNFKAFVEGRLTVFNDLRAKPGVISRDAYPLTNVTGIVVLEEDGVERIRRYPTRDDLIDDVFKSLQNRNSDRLFEGAMPVDRGLPVFEPVPGALTGHDCATTTSSAALSAPPTSVTPTPASVPISTSSAKPPAYSTGLSTSVSTASRVPVQSTNNPSSVSIHGTASNTTSPTASTSNPTTSTKASVLSTTPSSSKPTPIMSSGSITTARYMFPVSVAMAAAMVVAWYLN